MKSFELSYTIVEGDSWRDKNSINIKSNLADDKLIDCKLALSLVEQLKEGSAVLEADKLLLNIAEAQKREIQTNIEQLDDMALQAKVNADKAHEVLTNISEDSETKFLELEKSFSAIEKKFTDKIESSTRKIEQNLEFLTLVEEKLNKINSWSLDKLSEAIKQILELTAKDPKLIKLVLEHKKPQN